MEVLISKALIDPCINHDEFVSVNNALRGKNLRMLWNILNKNNENVLCQL